MRLKKPDAICRGCPLYEKGGAYYVPDTINDTSEVLILGQNPGENEVDGQRVTGYTYAGKKRFPLTESVTPQPLIGATGKWIKEQFWPLTGIPWESVSKANVIKCRYEGKNELPPLEQKITRMAALHCTTHLFKMPAQTRYILSLGQLALWYTTRQKSVEDWRGYALPYRLDHDNVLSKPRPVPFYFDSRHDLWHKEPIVMAAYHPAALFKGAFSDGEERSNGGNKRFYHATLADFRKFGRLVRGEWPQSLPAIHHNKLPQQWPDYAAFDTEYHPDTLQMYMWSLANREGDVYVVDARRQQQMEVASGATIIGQNVLADIRYLPKLMNIRRIKMIEDTMLAHSVLWPGEPHSLAYILSIYGEFNRHKHLGNLYPPDDIHDIDILYAGLDAYTTLHHAWKGMLVEFRKDQRSWNVYRNHRLPLVYIIGKAEQKGIKVDVNRLKYIEQIMQGEMAELQAEAQALTGDNHFNLGSNLQVATHLYR